MGHLKEVAARGAAVQGGEERVGAVAPRDASE